MDFYLPFAESTPFPDRNYHFPRKRLREEYSNNCNSIYDLEGCRSQKPKLSSFSSFLDEDMVFQFQQQQEEIERYIAHHVRQVVCLISVNFFVLKKAFFLILGDDF